MGTRGGVEKGPDSAPAQAVPLRSSVSQTSQETLAKKPEAERNLLNELEGVAWSAEGCPGEEAASLGSWRYLQPSWCLVSGTSTVSQGVPRQPQAEGRSWQLHLQVLGLTQGSSPAHSPAFC